MASHHPKPMPAETEACLLEVVRAARRLQSELDTYAPRGREAMIDARRSLRTALQQLDARN